MTLEKLHVGSSEDHDQAEQLSDSKASSSMEDHTVRRRKTAMQGREAGWDGGDCSHCRCDGNTTLSQKLSLLSSSNNH